MGRFHFVALNLAFRFGACVSQCVSRRCAVLVANWLISSWPAFALLGPFHCPNARFWPGLFVLAVFSVFGASLGRRAYFLALYLGPDLPFSSF